VVTVKNKEEMMRFIKEGFKPYYHKTVKRWYLRRGQQRHIIARELEAEAESIAMELKPMLRRVPDYKVAEAVKMRVEGASVPAIVEETGIPRSTLYEKFDKYDEGKISIEPAGKHVQTLPPKDATTQVAIVSVPEVSMTEMLKESSIFSEIPKQIENILTWISKSSEDSRRLIEKYLSEPENVKDLADLGVIVSALVALPLYQKMGLNPEPVLKVIRDIGRERGLL
jgi:transposase-like protein